jgi:putative hydrolase of the HAD superfamily
LTRVTPVGRWAVLLDVGDTLVHRPTVGPGRRLAEALGLDRDAARAITRLVFHERFAGPDALAARLADAFALDGDARAAVATVWAGQLEEPVETPGATALVRAAVAAGAHVALVSNIWAPYAAGFRRACPAIVPLVTSWHLSFEAGVTKPDPGLFHAALAAAGVPAERAVMIGDDLDKDVRPALALGMRAIWVRGDVHAHPRPPGAEVAVDLHEARVRLAAVLAAGRVDLPRAAG